MRIFVITALLFAAAPPLGQAQQISCGQAPKIQYSAEEKLKGDVEGQAQILTKRLGSTDLQGTIETSKTELYQQHQDVGRDEINLYFAWISCQTIIANSSISSSEKVTQWMTVYKVILGNKGIEPRQLADHLPLPENSSEFFVDGIRFSVKRLTPPSTNNQVSLILSVLNVNDKPTGLLLVAPAPTLTDESGNYGYFNTSEGIQWRSLPVGQCASSSDKFFEVAPNFPVNIIIRFNWPANNRKPVSASFTSRVLLQSTDKTSDSTLISLAFPDIPFKRRFPLIPLVALRGRLVADHCPSLPVPVGDRLWTS